MSWRQEPQKQEKLETFSKGQRVFQRRKIKTTMQISRVPKALLQKAIKPGPKEELATR
jgi:hypothetical protein